jgi:NAD-dependent deacetylase
VQAQDPYTRAASAIRDARRVTAFTGAGVSVESGIPPFRGEGGLWSKYDPVFLEIGHFRRHPRRSWELIKEIFYDFFGAAEPNAAHRALAALEQQGQLQTVITQNIDNLHQEAGSREVCEFHGTSRELLCEGCAGRHPAAQVDLSQLPPLCPACGGLLRPNFVFFGEPIPEQAMFRSLAEAEASDLFILIGTTGEIMPACSVPLLAKRNGAAIVEINPRRSSYTEQITDVFLQEVATAAMSRLLDALG